MATSEYWWSGYVLLEKAMNDLSEFIAFPPIFVTDKDPLKLLAKLIKKCPESEEEKLFQHLKKWAQSYLE